MGGGGENMSGGGCASSVRSRGTVFAVCSSGVGSVMVVVFVALK